MVNKTYTNAYQTIKIGAINRISVFFGAVAVPSATCTWVDP